MHKLIRHLIPFVLLGVVLVVIASGIVLISYLLLFGLLVGMVLFSLSWLRNKLFASKEVTKKTEAKPGRIIDTDDWRQL